MSPKPRAPTTDSDRALGGRGRARTPALGVPVESAPQDDLTGDITMPPTDALQMIECDEESGDPDLRDIARRLNTMVAVQREAIEKLWPARRVLDDVLEINQELVNLKAKLRVLEQVGPGVEEAQQARAEVRELALTLMGRDQNNGRIGNLRAEVLRSFARLREELWGTRKDGGVPGPEPDARPMAIEVAASTRWSKRLLGAATGLILGAIVSIWWAGAKYGDSLAEFRHLQDQVSANTVAAAKVPVLEAEVSLLLQLVKKPASPAGGSP
jgi:hypothetical protein